MTASWMSPKSDYDPSTFWSTTYSSSYTRPNTTQSRCTFPELRSNDISGFSSNNRVSPLDLAPLDDKSIYGTTSSHAAHSEVSTIKTLMKSKPITHAVMEHSGFWREPEPNVLYDSPTMRKKNEREREVNASYLDPLTLKRMAHKNPIDGENNGAGPRWGSTTNRTAYSRYENSHDRYWKTDRNLIGPKDENSFTRQHVTIGEKPIDEQTSTMKASYRMPPRIVSAEIPNRTVMEQSGFSNSVSPTMNRKMMLSDVSTNDLHPIEVSRLKHKNTPEYQNLYYPDPYMSTNQVSYRNPIRTMQRAMTATASIRRGNTGYNSNETITVGAPGDPRYHKTGKSETTKKFKDPATLRNHDVQQTPNIVERSGYWAT